MSESLFANHDRFTALFFREIFAFALTCGWALILFPLSRKHRSIWGLLSFAATILTIAVLYGGGNIAESPLLTDVLTASLLGACFGVAIIGNFFFSRSGEFAGYGIDESFFSRYGLSEIPSLRLLFQLAIGLKDESKAFFSNLAADLNTPEAIETCQMIVAEIGKSRDFLQQNLQPWFPSPANQTIIRNMVDTVKANGTFFPQTRPGLNSEQIVQLAIDLEIQFTEFFQTFEKTYPGDWKNMKIDFLIQTQQQQLQEFQKILNQKRAMKATSEKS